MDNRMRITKVPDCIDIKKTLYMPQLLVRMGKSFYSLLDGECRLLNLILLLEGVLSSTSQFQNFFQKNPEILPLPIFHSVCMCYFDHRRVDKGHAAYFALEHPFDFFALNICSRCFTDVSQNSVKHSNVSQPFLYDYKVHLKYFNELKC